jgi:hypothetical protein
LIVVETVTIACKLPNGIHLDVFRMDDWNEQTPTGVRATKRAVRDGRFTLNGTRRRTDDPRIAEGFALTHGVPAEHWARWLDANKDSALVTNGLIFAQKGADVRAQAREKAGQLSGLEPIDPKNLPREFRGKIETADRPS